MFDKFKSNQKSVAYLGVITMLTLFTIITSFSYALLTKDVVGERHYSMQFGKFDLSMQGEENSIQLMNAYPMTDEEGKALTPYKFTITNTGDYEEEYRVLLIEDEEGKASCSGCTFLNPNKLRYEVTIDGIAQTPRAAYTTTVLDRGVLTSNQTKSYELKVWLNYDATIEEENKYYYGKIKVEAYQVSSSQKISEKVFASENLGNDCETYDDGVDTFLIGQCSKNYVWYSGKLWRVVLKNNETGVVKMVTDNDITTTYYNDHGNTNFENSYADQWLNQEFLPTLHGYENYLISNSIWDMTSNSSNSISSNSVRPAESIPVQTTVGFLNSYEYSTIVSHSKDLPTGDQTYLKNGAYWFLFTKNDDSYMKCVGPTGQLLGGASQCGNGIRPAVKIKPDIQLFSGEGTIDSPYRLVHDESKVENGSTLLSTRYSGEYVKLNNTLYRLVGVENGLTKVTAVDIPESLVNVQFNTTFGIDFSSASIQEKLNAYYQSFDEQSKRLVEENTTWYQAYGEPYPSYKTTICKTVDVHTSASDCERYTDSYVAISTIGLPRVGEMFSSHITRGEKQNFWTLSVYHGRETETTLVYLYQLGVLYDDYAQATKISARPSMYLKQNVVISSTNTGDGTYEHPYDIELGK